jgi:hypothetical protein
MATTPKLNVKLLGEEQMTLLDKTITWTPSDKLETTLVINSADGSKAISITNIETVKTMVFYGTGSYKVSITVDTNTIDFETQDFFIFSPTAVFRSTIDAISVSTASSSDIEIQVRVYGGE